MATRTITIGANDHASSHAAGGDDQLTPAAIGAPATADLAAVAFTGAYDDLIGEPAPVDSAFTKIITRTTLY